MNPPLHRDMTTALDKLRYDASARVLLITGAGDAFCAGFLAAWLNGAPPKAATETAVATAARAVSALGGRPLWP
jgi:sugar/nucleoside kinase (ribokinase family)